MDAERFRRAKDLLLLALEVDASERSAWLERACEGDTALHREVSSLLDQQDRPARIVDEGVLTTSAGRELGAAIDSMAERTMPHRIGPFDIVGVLGEGGMGVVYHGRQTEPFERDVAVKAIRRGMDSERVLARFEWERRSLARMDHPHIASILDAGTDERGQPYVAMPLIRGLPVTHFCDEAKLDPMARVRLFLRICHAVEHAHGRGILHRDLKPSNILVREVEGQPSPTVIDFGIAKALDIDTESDLTMEGQRVGTPAYMSPEQLRSSGGDADVRSDVYALGVILYELLSGQHPMGDRVDEVTRQMAAGVEPTGFPSPSTALAIAKNTEELAAKRSVSTQRLRRVLRGDLDTICLAATRTERSRRYASVGHLIDDIERYLDRRPVLARPDSFTYRFGKFARRHAVGVTIASALLVMLIAGGVMLALYADRVGHERDRARVAEAQARHEADANAEIVRFLEELFTELDPEIGSAADATAREVLAAGAERVRTELLDQPMVRARLFGAIGYTHFGISALNESKQLLLEGLALLESVPVGSGPGENDPALVAIERARIESMLGNVTHDLSQFDESEAHDRRAVAAFRAAGPSARSELGAALSYLAVSVQAQGRLDEALPLLEESIAISRELGGPQDRDAAWSENVRGYVLYQMGRLPDALAASERALDAQRGNEDVPPTDLIDTLNNLCGYAIEWRDFDKAQRYSAEALELARANFSNIDHPHLARAHLLVGRVSQYRGEMASAEESIRTGLEMSIRAVGLEHRNSQRALSTLAQWESESGLHDEAVTRQRGVVEVLAANMGEDDRETRRHRYRLAQILVEAERWDEAADLIDRVVSDYESRFGTEHFQSATTFLLRARVSEAREDYDRARADLAIALPVLQSTYAEDHEHVERARELLERIQSEAP